MRDIRSYFSVGDKLSLIEMSFRCGWLPTSTWITLGGSCCSKHFFHWRSSCWALRSTSNGSISLSCSAWLIDVMLAKSFSKITPTLISESQSLMIAMVRTRQTLILNREVVAYSNLRVCGRNSWLVFLPVRKVAKVCAALCWYSNHPCDLISTPFFSSCDVLTMHNERIAEVLCRHLILWMSWLELGLYRIQSVIGPF